MEKYLKHRNNNYFNNLDYYLILDLSLKKLYLTKLELNNLTWYTKQYKKYRNATFYTNGRWYDSGAPSFKMTSIICVNVNELIGKNIKYKNTELTGKLTKCIYGNFGVLWDKQLTSEVYKKYGFPYFWNELNKLELV